MLTTIVRLEQKGSFAADSTYYMMPYAHASATMFCGCKIYIILTVMFCNTTLMKMVSTGNACTNNIFAISTLQYTKEAMLCHVMRY